MALAKVLAQRVVGSELLAHVTGSTMIGPLNGNDGAVFNLQAGDSTRENAASRVEVWRTAVEWEGHAVGVPADHDPAVSIDPVDDALLELPRFT